VPRSDYEANARALRAEAALGEIVKRGAVQRFIAERARMERHQWLTLRLLSAWIMGSLFASLKQ
jgi:hypothetical protein